MTYQGFPIEKEIPALQKALQEGKAAVLVASPGAGKTTIVPLALLDRDWLNGKKIVMLQPRRLAALNAARRMADLHGSQLGETIGYQIRFQRCIGPNTRIEVITEGLLTRRLQGYPQPPHTPAKRERREDLASAPPHSPPGTVSRNCPSSPGAHDESFENPSSTEFHSEVFGDPYLQETGLLIFDEFHERNINSDLGLAMARELQQTVRPDLKILVMSATLVAEPVSHFLGDCPVVVGHGFLHPVSCSFIGGGCDGQISRSATVAVRRVLAEDPAGGDLLVFLPGAGEIAQTQELLELDDITRGVMVIPLHGSLSLDRQGLAIRKQARRKVVLATNIAETSLTIEGITTVIDSGWCRVLRLDPAVGLEKLCLERISRASADQRAGRAGRTGPGRVLRLWTEAEHDQLPAATTPEILRIDLTETALYLAGWGKTDPASFGWFQPPPAPSLASACKILRALGAVDENGAVTVTGRKMLELPISPRLSRMLVESAAFGLVDDASDLAALLSERDLVVRSGTHRTSPFVGRSDFLWRLDLLNEARAAGFRGSSGTVDLRVAKRVEDVSRRLSRAANRNHPGGNDLRGAIAQPSHDPICDRGTREKNLLRLLLCGFPDRVARRRSHSPGSDSIQYLMVGGRGMRLDSESSVRNSDLIIVVAADASGHGQGNEGMIRWASHIEMGWLSEIFPHLIHHEREVFFDGRRQSVVARCRTYFDDLIIEETVSGLRPQESGLVASALAEEISRDPQAIFSSSDEFIQFRARIELLRTIGGLDDLPTLDENWLRTNARRLVENCRTLEDVRNLDLAALVERELGHPERRALETLVPERLVVPTGSRIKLIYQLSGNPILRVKLQELFGLLETPRIIGGRIPVLIHLLSPAGRPLQITKDLKSFWQNTYPALRREMRGQYPRHPWPEDPLTAAPQRGANRRTRTKT
ncbi:ATP-dependent helicase HrpB [bacterium CG2_30_54_10]|nr:MAG: ATP-dependent helicase HrpB [bacterium CG2_30_54_10]